jgi:hypothetical protein
MKPLLLAIALILIIIAVAGAAVLCPDTPAGYIRSNRPTDIPANYPPPEEPACYMRTTQASNNHIFICIMCHDNRSIA